MCIHFVIGESLPARGSVSRGSVWGAKESPREPVSSLPPLLFASHLS